MHANIHDGITGYNVHDMIILTLVSSCCLTCSLRERPQIEHLVRYIVEEAPEDAEKTRSFKYVWSSCNSAFLSRLTACN